MHATTKLRFLFGLTLLAAATVSQGQSPMDFFRASGRNILPPNGTTNFVMRGIALNAWLTPEAYAWQLTQPDADGYTYLGSYSDIKDRISVLLNSATDEQAFWNAYTSNYVTGVDCALLKSQGYNVIRLPFNHRMLSTLGPTNSYLESGFQVLSNMVQWCKANGLYVVLDMHSAPGGQSADAPADPESTQWTWTGSTSNQVGVACLWTDTGNTSGRTSAQNKQRTIDMWKEIARRFRTETQVAGYDLINEPVLPAGVNTSTMRTLYSNITAAIRLVDTNHLILIQGNTYASSTNGLGPMNWDPQTNLALVFHKYWSTNSPASIQPFTSFSSTYNVPLIMGEAGENSNPWNYELRQLLETNSPSIGWLWWDWKKVDSISGQYSAKVTSNYEYVITNFRKSANSTVVKQGLMEMASGILTTNCLFDPGWVASLVSPQFGTTSVPFASAVPLPGVIYAPNYDVGYQNVSYSDTDTEATSQGQTWNYGWTYRNDGVDIYYPTSPDSDPLSIGYYVGQTADDEWQKFTVNVTTSGNYQLAFRVATGSDGGQIQLLDGATSLASLTVPNVFPGQWEHFFTITNTALTFLAAGTHTLQLKWISSPANVAWIEVRPCAGMEVTGPVSGPTSVSAGQNGVPYSVGATAGASTYAWTVPSGASVASGQGTRSITVDYSCSSVSGVVTVTPSSGGGCNGTPSSLPVTVVSVGAAGAITGPASVCAGQSGVSYSISDVSGATTYSWTVPTGASVASGQGTTSVTVDWGSTPGDVTVTPSSDTCSGTASSLAVGISTAPGIIGQSGSQTVCAGGQASFGVTATGGGLTYQWRKNGVPLSDGGTVSGATTTNVTLMAVVAGDSGSAFDCVVSGTCSPAATSSVAALTVNTNPTAFNVTGGGSYPAGGGGVPVGLDGSQLGVNYQLQLDAADVGSPEAGTAVGLSFGSQTATGTYTVVAIDGTTGCTAPMNGSATVTVTPPTPYQQWQLEYFGCLDCTQADAEQDPDGDGQNNMAEFLSGTNPTNSTSVLRIISVSQVEMNIDVRWSTAGNHTNALQAVSAGAGGSYTNEFEDVLGAEQIIISGSGDTTTNYVDVGAATNRPSRFYRVRLVP
ncbi:MAG TPA: cellulase family glycosylhydrolase [Verrucomicrobiae bacterium]|nr:cellulase family glycosylhydrolase [Verrucomicrobiae bacterium]